jgi:hypothetical protein
LKELEYEGNHRYISYFNRNPPIKEEINPDYTSTWDNYKNNNLEKRNKVNNFFLK